MLTSNFVGTLEAAIKANWNRKALSNFQGETYNFSDVAHQIKKIHNAFELAGIQEGDKITLIGKNQASWGISYIAIVSYGAVVVPLLVDFKPKDVLELTKHSDSVAMFTCNAVRKLLPVEELENVRFIANIEDFSLSYVNGISEEELSTALTQELQEKLTPESFNLKHIPNDQLLGILYTSGTSGYSKGVMLNHDSLIANIEFAHNNMPLKGGDEIVSFLPMAHAYGCAFEFLFPFSLGCHIVILGKVPSPQIILKAFSHVKPRLILMVPLVLEKVYKNRIKEQISKQPAKTLLRVPLIKNLIYKKIKQGLVDAFGGNFVEVIIGGAALNPEVENFLRKIKFPYTVGYGMTECGPLISYVNNDKSRMASAGKLVHTLEVKIEKENPTDADGEIMVRGNNVMLGYYKNEEATQEVLTEDRWLHTGDLGHVDQDGYIYIRGRSKSLILGPSGKNIYPEEIEARFNNLSFVVESLAVHRDMKNIILLHPDKDKLSGMAPEEQDKLIRSSIKKINAEMPSYYAISDYELKDEEFEKTAKRSIRRFLYK